MVSSLSVGGSPIGASERGANEQILDRRVIEPRDLLANPEVRIETFAPAVDSSVAPQTV